MRRRVHQRHGLTTLVTRKGTGGIGRLDACRSTQRTHRCIVDPRRRQRIGIGERQSQLHEGQQQHEAAESTKKSTAHGARL